ncbi:DUF6624 domain-containing protein [Flavobacterium humidisoli]|jgi:hypothetical protein|uniref:Lipoprotein n=1 Tax=Flavobacterium humidisoli TaxID=2937442 RepID=A0ABY4LY29_9FLAO|nr:DUF6624 domain-containing protein [Flavobacterium humidisoli]UPZ17994.1 hypothetical protein M0M44_11745 [Flavobacterium humidisoli]
MKTVGTLLILLITFSNFISCKIQKKEFTNDMKIKLKTMYNKDQELQKYDLKRISSKEYTDSMKLETKKNDEYNSRTIKVYFKNYGFPGVRENGEETALNFWLIVQHCDNDVDFQEKVLHAMKKELRDKNVSARNYAYLYDRVKKNKNEKQFYGTQMVWDTNGIHSLYPVKDIQNLNKRRKNFGLEPIEDYIKSFNHN